MITMEKILETVARLKTACKTMDALVDRVTTEYQDEQMRIKTETQALIDEMQQALKRYEAKHFSPLLTQLTTLAADLEMTDDFSTVVQAAHETETCLQLKEELFDAIRRLNDWVKQLNETDFDRLVPPVSIELLGEEFITYQISRENAKQYSTNSQKPTYSEKLPKQVNSLLTQATSVCREAITLLARLRAAYERDMNFARYAATVRSDATAWLAEAKAKKESIQSKKYTELFLDESAGAVPKSFFTTLEAEGLASEVDPAVAPSSYARHINIGDLCFPVAASPQHIKYFADSPVLATYTDTEEGSVHAPLILDMKHCGNLLLNVNEETYAEDTVAFVNQLIMQFLLAYPANRISLCLIDIDDRMHFSQYKLLTKINTDILYNGIIRDDRQLEDTIKDMEQTMYKVDDDVLSFNSVADIFEYNEKFEANPQNIHLFVLVNYPSGMRDDIARRALKIIQSGNRCGIFSIVINNRACSLSPGYKQAEHTAFLDGVAKYSTVIDKDAYSGFSLRVDADNEFYPNTDITLDLLPGIVTMLKDSAEKTLQKSIPFTRLLEDTDAVVASPKGLAPSSAVLDIPIGARGGEVQSLLLKTTGDGSSHAVVIGGTGSGKSNLLHTIIMSACYKYSPDELNLYLVDFKGGVEFKFYEAGGNRAKQLPHIKLLGLTSNLEDGVAILSNLLAEQKRREDVFRTAGAEDIVQYRALGHKMPRLLVIVDEIQELFLRDERLGEKAIAILSAFFLKGRAFGINILWASQNIPNAPGLKNRVLSQIGNRISLRLNEPEDAREIKIDPKAVKNLTRPEKGLALINDIRYGNDSIEFRVAFAENSENRTIYTDRILEKWKTFAADAARDPLFIVGDEEEASPLVGESVYNAKPATVENPTVYTLQLGQNYISGKPHSIVLDLYKEKMNLLMAGFDLEILRDMMGYSLLSTLIAHSMNAHRAISDATIYCANGEMISQENSLDLFNVLRADFGHVVENVSKTTQLLACILKAYNLYKQRREEADGAEQAAVFAPTFIFIHSLQRYTDLFNENPMLKLEDEPVPPPVPTSPAIPEAVPTEGHTPKADLFKKPSFIADAPQVSVGRTERAANNVFFTTAFTELLQHGGQFGIHFVISTDNPLSIAPIKEALCGSAYKILVKGINANVMSQILEDYKNINTLNDTKIALVAMQDTYEKIKTYRYDIEKDGTWYTSLRDTYKALLGGTV